MRNVFGFFLTSLLILGGTVASLANDGEWKTSTSLVGESKYKDKFDRYSYVNPDAIKGGTLNNVAQGTFDSFNPFIVIGKPAAGLTYFGGVLWDNLMTQSTDESSVSHPMVAEAFKNPADFSSATYRLNTKARWHDGKPITAEDVKWSMETLKEISPQWGQYFTNVSEIRIDNEHQVTFVFDQANNRELPHIMGDLPVLPKHWWTGKDKDGKQRDISKPTLEIPLGSGPYKIESFKPGTSVVWKRVEDYWAQDLGTRVGRYNFDRLKYEYFTDDNAMWQAFTKGGFEDMRVEGEARRWANDYNFPAVEKGHVKQATFPVKSAYITLMLYMNTRRPIFQDRRVRKALVWAMNFEDMNKNLFYDLYSRSTEYFGGTELSSKGLPSGRELEILEEYRGKIPDEVFTDEFKMPVYKDRRDGRKHLKTALDLLNEAGWVRKGTDLVNKETGEKFEFELLTASSTSERRYKPWLDSLRRLGIKVNLRLIDPSQFIQRRRNFDFDVLGARTLQSSSPGNEQREYWTTDAAKKPGSRNWMGASDPVLNELTQKIIFAKNREELVAHTNALDRILKFQYYTVPLWYAPDDWVGYWDKFDFPEQSTVLQGNDTWSWWIVPEKEAALNAEYGR